MHEQAHVERLQRVRRASALEDIHPVRRIVAILRHRDIDVEPAVDVVQLRGPHVCVP